MEKKTPLYDKHIAYGAKMVPFAGWLLPERYGAGVIEEHMAVRRNAGIFDVSHMGELIISGVDALNNLQYLFTNDFSKMKDGQVRYTVMCDESGGIIDDMLVYRMSEDRFYIVVNASNRASDADWMRERVFGAAELTDVSDRTAQIAVQGPVAVSALAKLTDAAPAARYTFTENAKVAGVPCLISRSGYTGEDGFEIYCEPGQAGAVWDALIDAGRGEGVIPCGLGARDTLRLEAALPLYGHEMDRGVTPVETGLEFAVKMKKDNFIGKAALLAGGKPARRRVGVKITGRGIARENYTVYYKGAEIGKTTSGTYCPYLGYAAAMALVDARVADGSAVTVDIRGRLTDAEITPLPFYKRAP